MMAVKILVNEKNVLELDLGDMDQSLAQLLAEKLSADSSVEFAAYKMDHPVYATPKLYVRTKKGDPLKLVLEKVEEARKEINEFKEKFAKIVQ